VSGHTHGGQVDVPGIRGLITPSRHGTRFKAGHIVEDGRHLYVCRGVGTSHLPIRLGAPPEIALLTLRSVS
jgi:predicted MPP superfamily phosphohydrolase